MTPDPHSGDAPSRATPAEPEQPEPEQPEPGETGSSRVAADDTGSRQGSSQESPSRRSPTKESGGGLAHLVREVAIVGITALVISFLIKTFLVQAFWIPSGSMEQTLVFGDRVMVSKIQAGPTELERGDIAVFQDPGGWLPQRIEVDRGPLLNGTVDALEFVGLAPAGDGDHLIKRVIGTSGDRVVCCDDQGRVTVNDEPLEETYLFPGDEPSLEQFDIVVPPDSFWMMGDHRSNSRDSRANDDGTGTGGAVPAADVVGQALVLVWPLDRFDWFDRPADVFGDVPVAQEGS